MQRHKLYAQLGRSESLVQWLPGTLRLRGSVGAGGANARQDVAAVQAALNGVPIVLAGPNPQLETDGRIGPKTIAAIRRFQDGWIGRADGRIDPGRATLACLNMAMGIPSGRVPLDLPPNATGPAAAVWGAMGGAVIGATGLAAVAAAAATAGVAPPPPAPDMLRAMQRLDDLRQNVLIGCEMTMKMAVQVAERAFDYAGRLVAPGRGLPGWNSREAPGRLAFLLLAKHFHLSEAEPARALAAATQVLHMARRVRLRLVTRRASFGVLHDQSDLYVATFRRPPHAWNAVAYNGTLGGADLKPTPTGNTVPAYPYDMRRESTDRIYLTPLWDAMPDTEKQITVLHELLHFLGGTAPGIDDHAYAHQRHYATLNPALRIRNTDCYALFFAETYHGSVATARNMHIALVDMGALPFVEPGGEVVLPAAPSPPDRFAFPCSFPVHR